MTTESESMAGRVCVVTGATSGIGRVTALGLARLGATVVACGRDEARTRATVEALRRESGNPAVEYALADLTDQAQVRAMAAEIAGRHPRLDVLINNAGGFFMRRRESVEGVEMTLALNHLAPFLLTNLLLDRLQASAPARVVNVSSDMHRNVTLDLDDLQMTTSYRGTAAYGRAKLALVLFTYELARHLEGSGVTANALHPGFVATGIGLPALLEPLLKPLMRLVARSPEEGARTSLYLATSPQVAGVTGAYYIDEQAVDSAPLTYDEDLARRLWQISAGLTGLRRTEDLTGFGNPSGL
jgi:NAD(P)-dependent dehydrogenase (short-subunit alcohol dehydrogenase family)